MFSSKGDFKGEAICSRVPENIDDISRMVIDGIVENVGPEKNKLRIAILQQLWLEKKKGQINRIWSLLKQTAKNC